jgi:hypothetical protein
MGAGPGRDTITLALQGARKSRKALPFLAGPVNKPVIYRTYSQIRFTMARRSAA